MGGCRWVTSVRALGCAGVGVRWTAPLLAVCVVAGCASAGTADHGDADGDPDVVADVTGDVSGAVTVRARADVNAPADEVDGVRPLTAMVDVRTDGAVTGDVEIRVPLTQTEAPGGDHVVFAVTAETPDGPWELLPAEVDGDAVVITTTHLSLFQAFTSLLSAVGSVAKEAFHELTSNVVAEASRPTCEDEQGARSEGHDISSDDGDTVYWCFGRDSEGRFLRVVNNRRYALLLSYGDSLSVLEQSQLGLDIVERLSRTLTLEDQVTVAPRDQVTFRVEAGPGGSAVVASELDGVGSALAQLQAGVDTLVAILSRFGAGPRPGSPEADSRLLRFLDDVDCVDAIGTGNAGAIVGRCFDFDLLREVFGFGAASLLAPVVAAGSLAAYFQSQLNALGDQITGRDRYTITIRRDRLEPPEAVDPPAPTLPVLRDHGLGPLTVGMSIEEALATGWVGDERVSCGASLGLDPDGTERAFDLGGPTSPAGLAGLLVFMEGKLYEIDVSSGAIAAGAFELPADLTLPEAQAALEAAGYDVEVTTTFEPDDYYLMATEGDGDTLSVIGSPTMVAQAGLPQLTTCD